VKIFFKKVFSCIKSTRETIIKFVIESLLLFAITISFYSVYRFFINKHTGLADLVQLSTVIAGTAAAVSVFYLAKQIREASDTEKINRTCDFIKRYNDPVQGKIFSDTLIILNDKKKREVLFVGKRIEDQNYVKLRQTIGLTLNFFEELATLYNNNLVHKEITEEYFGKISKIFFERCKKYIQKREAQTNREKIFEQWRIMNNSNNK
jgi:hypothetical protein